MTTEQFRATLHLQPFRAFTIRMTDGRRFHVVHPNFVAQSKSGRAVVVFQADEGYSVLDLLFTSELEVDSGNGKSAVTSEFESRRSVAKLRETAVRKV